MIFRTPQMHRRRRRLTLGECLVVIAAFALVSAMVVRTLRSIQATRRSRPRPPIRLLRSEYYEKSRCCATAIANRLALTDVLE
jgi:hypothetical protein